MRRMAHVQTVIDGAALIGAQGADVCAAAQVAHKEDVAVAAGGAEVVEVAAGRAGLAAALGGCVEAADLDAWAVHAAWGGAGRSAWIRKSQVGIQSSRIWGPQIRRPKIRRAKVRWAKVWRTHVRRSLSSLVGTPQISRANVHGGAHVLGASQISEARALIGGTQIFGRGVRGSQIRQIARVEFEATVIAIGVDDTSIRELGWGSGAAEQGREEDGPVHETEYVSVARTYPMDLLQLPL